ncbi:hypothetical protein ACT7CX_25590 [Bacillus cereus]
MACSECEGDGAFDVEALFVSQEKAKPPNILATGAGYYIKAEAARSEQELYIKQNSYYCTVIGIFIYTVHNLFKLIPAKGLIYTNY